MLHHYYFLWECNPQFSKWCRGRAFKEVVICFYEVDMSMMRGMTESTRAVVIVRKTVDKHAPHQPTSIRVSHPAPRHEVGRTNVNQRASDEMSETSFPLVPGPRCPGTKRKFFGKGTENPVFRSQSTLEPPESGPNDPECAAPFGVGRLPASQVNRGHSRPD